MIKYDEIWLQDFGYGETTWCQDQINNDDERYIRATIADQRIAALEAELAAWREMARQVEELVRGRHVVEIDGGVLDNGEIGYSLWARQRNSWGHGVSGPTLPAAVAAAYEQVGVGDE